jgi:hypothetical protein
MIYIDHGQLMREMTRPSQFSPGYVLALEALRKCARSYSPAAYAAATAALQYVWDADEIETVEGRADRYSDYNKAAQDKKLMRLAAKVDAIHRARASA